MKNIKYFIGTAMFCLGLVSCDVLDLNDTSVLSDIAVWNSEAAADMYITASYKTFTDVSQVYNSRKVFYDSYSDLMKSTSWDQYSHSYNKVLLQANSFSTGSAGAFECWEDVYGRIRRANVLLDEITRYGSKYGEDWCNIRRAEVRLCRAFSYYRLIRVYGGIVLRTETSGTNGVDDGTYEGDVNRARLSEAESWNFVIQELKWAANFLPETWPSAGMGRATKKTAYGLLSRVGVYAKEWQVVIDAADEVQKLGGQLVSDYAKIFQVDGGQDNSAEILFALYYLKGSVVHNFDKYNRPFGDNEVYNTQVYAEHVPTAELADLYEFKDGTSFEWNTYAEYHSDPYTDREPRFHATILYNGCNWEGRKIESDVDGKDRFIAFTQSGSTNGHTCTGYYLRKYLQENNKTFANDHSWQYDVVLRYAEVLLNKAEAYAELDYESNKELALAALNEVRARVKLPTKTILEVLNKEEFMSLLRKERCVELAGEGFRYWDLRRWRLAINVINEKNAHGVKITKADDGICTYEKVSCDGGSQRVFLEKYYYFSLPTAEIANNKLCENNPYW